MMSRHHLMNYHYWYALVWSATIALYSLGWSDLNRPLEPSLILFFSITIVTSLLLGTLRNATLRPWRSETAPIQRPTPLITIALALGFMIDFWYRREVPLLTGSYAGYDTNLDIQATVGIPIVHVILIAGSIFYSLVLAECYTFDRRPRYILEFTLIQLALLLNYSRGYIAMCVLAAVLILTSSSHHVRVTNGRVRRGLVAAAAAYLVLVGIGLFGNYRSGGAWGDASYIDRIGQFNASFPPLISQHLKWSYTYLTSPLANLNFNVIQENHEGNLFGVIWSFVPESISKYATADAQSVLFQVEYLNASTGFIQPYTSGGGISGLYAAYVMQLVILGACDRYVRKKHAGELLFSASAALVVVGFAFFNTFVNSATCYLIPMVIVLAYTRAKTLANANGIDRKPRRRFNGLRVRTAEKRAHPSGVLGRGGAGS